MDRIVQYQTFSASCLEEPLNEPRPLDCTHTTLSPQKSPPHPTQYSRTHHRISSRVCLIASSSSKSLHISLAELSTAANFHMAPHAASPLQLNLRSLFNAFQYKRHEARGTNAQCSADIISSKLLHLQHFPAIDEPVSPTQDISPTGSSVFCATETLAHTYPDSPHSSHSPYPRIRATISRKSTSTFSLPSLITLSPAPPTALKRLFNDQNMDILGVMMQYMHYRTRQAASVVNSHWYQQFLLVIQPTEKQYHRVLKSRHHYRAALHLYRRRNLDGTPLFAANFEDNLPLRCFARFGAYSVVKELLANETVSPAACNQRALRKAAKHGHFKCCKLLLAHKDVYPTAQCVIKAMDRKQFSVVKLLLDDGRIDPAMEDGAILHRAASCGQLDLVHILIKRHELRPESSENRALRYAAYNGHAYVVETLLQYPTVDPSSQNHSALRRAVKRGHIDVCEVLLEDPRCNPSSFVFQLVRDAQEEGHMDIVDMLSARYASAIAKSIKRESQSGTLGHSSSVSNLSVSGAGSQGNISSTSGQALSTKLERLVNSILHPTQTVRRISM